MNIKFANVKGIEGIINKLVSGKCIEIEEQVLTTSHVIKEKRTIQKMLYSKINDSILDKYLENDADIQRMIEEEIYKNGFKDGMFFVEHHSW